MSSRDTEGDIFVGTMLPNTVDVAEGVGNLFHQASQLGFGDGFGWVDSIGMEDGVLLRTTMFRIWFKSSASLQPSRSGNTDV